MRSYDSLTDIRYYYSLSRDIYAAHLIEQFLIKINISSCERGAIEIYERNIKDIFTDILSFFIRKSPRERILQISYEDL